MELFNFNIKRFLIFSQKKAFLIFRESETQQKFFVFQETKLSYILERNFRFWKNKRIHSEKNFLCLGNGTF